MAEVRTAALATWGATGGVVTVLDASTGAVVTTVPVGDVPEGIDVAPVPPPVIGGQTWYSSGAKSSVGPAGSTVSLYAVGGLEGVPYQLTMSSETLVVSGEEQRSQRRREPARRHWELRNGH